ncbi:AbrB family transcriptional regulator [Azomonas macrocytogenes]|uniref:Ammonia monooxygenase n=1 Tax=Azomonas macrocytogenes TaxID=69962 RepID=A0A839T940_AZOMA|nr:AbrB family transcriptional regulator [Azomonas macrocytogenes]MBB3105400.1 hypothetical protein [Azomonas macrocytogenes]
MTATYLYNFQRLVIHNKPWILTPPIGALGGYLAQWMNWPLPWMIGALVGVALYRCLGHSTQAIPQGVKVGQWIIATGIGLHFNQQVMIEILAYFDVILLGTLVALSTSIVGIFIHRHYGEDLATAYFASMPGGANEMVNLGRLNGADLARIAAGQSLRMVLVLLIVPASYTWLFGDAHGSNLIHYPVNFAWLALLLFLGALVGQRFQHWQVPNAWQLGALLVSITVSVTFDLHIGLPTGAGEFGQWLVGSTLGCYFDRAFFRRAPAFMLRMSIATLSIMVLSIPIALMLGWMSNLDMRTLMLGMMPGGIAEMSLTAEALQLLVPLVTAMQVLRLLIVLFMAQPIFRQWYRYRESRK